ncbi:hypothetical protein BG006_008697 [Podila minutissima]|uniref:Uncharacterized protein n=1 Tax=Podila minutissima TaxID=64525 RepID=A0A9P5SUI1_9FUNG|nr:hypothetical protein BG006_008697 [Podila minutissima]
MSSEHQPSGLEPAEVVVEEVVTVAEESEPTAAILSVLPPPASATTKPSRLSTAFKRISNGCGLCIHPFRNSGPTDYHALVHTPADETPGVYQDPYNVAPVSVPEPKSGNYKDEIDVAGSSAAAADHYSEIHYHRETKVDESQNIQPHQQQDQFTFVEEITVMSSANDDIVEDDTKEEEIEARIEVEKAADIERTVEDTLMKTTAIASHASTTFEKTSVSPVSPVSPIPIRTNGTFAKFSKRSTSSSAVSAPRATSSTSPSTPSSPLLERLGRFAKIIRHSETSSSTQSKIESLKVSATPTVEVPVVAKAEVESGASSKTSVQKDIHVEIQETVLDKVGEAKEETASSIEETSTTTWANATSPPPQPQQQTSDRRDLLVDTAVLVPKSQPVAVPGKSQQIHPWTHSPTTLHQNDASSSSNPSLSRTGRTSTIDSTLEGSEESVDSGKEASKVTKRRKSVLKKLGNIINNMNTNRRNSSDSKEGRVERRRSRHGSQTMESPIEADENFLSK